jgi:uncharacterized iron-regulated protein
MLHLKNKVLTLAALFTLCSFTLSSDKPVYKLFTNKGKVATYKLMLAKAKNADIVLFGEMHDNPIEHWLQLELTQDLFKLKGKQLVLSAEMFEADNQAILNSYLSGEIDVKKFETDCRLWPNYKTDYKPLVNFAKDNGLTFVAANIPRKYASLVYKKGPLALDTLASEEKAYMAPLPFLYDSTLSCYSDIFKMAGGHGGQNLPMSQAIKDATMAHFIMQNYAAGKQIIHYNGTYHSNNYQSIYWYLKQANPNLKIVTIAAVEQSNLKKLEKENKGLADFIIVTPPNLTKTH